MSMLDLLLPKIEMTPKLKFGGVDLSRLPLPKGLKIHPDAAEFFATCIPNETVQIWRGYISSRFLGKGQWEVRPEAGSYELYSQKDLIPDNRGHWMMGHFLPHGFCSIASMDGNLIVYDLRTAQLFYCCIDVCYSEDSIIFSKGPGLHETIPMNAEGIRHSATSAFMNFKHFCQGLLSPDDMKWFREEWARRRELERLEREKAGQRYGANP